MGGTFVWRVSQVRNGSGNIRTYTDADALTGITTTYTGFAAKAIGYAYFPNGLRKAMTTPLGAFGYTYDAGGRPKTLINPANEVTEWTFDVADRLTRQKLGNGIYTDYEYNPVGGDRSAVKNYAPNGSVISSYTIPTTGGFDGAGNLKQVLASVPAVPALSGLTQWGYDTKDRLTTEQTTRAGGWNHAHNYDATENPTTLCSQVRTFNSKNQLTGGTGLGAFVYDSHGNPTTYNGVALTWDKRDNATAFGNLLTAGYRADGLRAWKQDSNGKRVYFFYDGTVPVFEYRGNGDYNAHTTFGANGLVSRQENPIINEFEGESEEGGGRLGTITLPGSIPDAYLPEYLTNSVELESPPQQKVV